MLRLRVHGVEYDASAWAARHPGGRVLLEMLDGCDASQHFDAAHAPGGAAQRVLQKLPRTGACGPNAEHDCVPPFVRAVAEERARLERAGLFTPQPLAYVPRAAALAAMLAAALGVRLVVPSAALFALFLQQCAFVGHDAGHNSVLATPAANARLGVLVGNLLTGVSIGWWKSTHNAHHAATNALEWDPDIQHAPVLVVSPAFLAPRGVFSAFHRRWLGVLPRERTLVRYQHWYFYPLMAVARFNLYWQSACYALRPDVPRCEAAALAGYFAGLALWTASWPTLQHGLAWLLLSHALAGILHVQIALSHFFQPCYAGPVRAGPAFVAAQLEGTTDLAVPWWCAWFHGGLQWQAAHHVFPRLPRDHLPRARAALRDLCARHGVTYHVCGWWAANAALVRALAAAGRAGDTRTVCAAWHAVG